MDTLVYSSTLHRTRRRVKNLGIFFCHFHLNYQPRICFGLFKTQNYYGTSCMKYINKARSCDLAGLRSSQRYRQKQKKHCCFSDPDGNLNPCVRGREPPFRVSVRTPRKVLRPCGAHIRSTISAKQGKHCCCSAFSCKINL